MMLKSHRTYLKRVVSLASHIKTAETLVQLVEGIKVPKTPQFSIIRDICCDSRFYSIVENDNFWKEYAQAVISNFIDSLKPEDWQDIHMWTGKKEEFLNRWLACHIMPMTQDEQKMIGRRWGISQKEIDADVSPADMWGIRDYTDEDNNEQTGPLPKEIAEYATEMGGIAPGQAGESHKAEASYLGRLDPSLVELAKKIGRSGWMSHATNGKFQHASRSDISGITVGNDLNSVLPAEMALLGNGATENLFYHRYVQKRLQVFSSASNTDRMLKSSGGPIYICVDTSGSMTGEPEKVAKTLSLAISVIAQSEKRPICMINYSHRLSYFVLTDLNTQRERFLRFLSHSYSGGNDETRLFRFIFSQLPQQRRCRQLAATFKGADMLIISDYQWGPLGQDVYRLILKARKAGMKFYALGVDMNHNISTDELEIMDYDSGYKFFADCDYRYVYRNGYIVKHLNGQ